MTKAKLERLMVLQIKLGHDGPGYFEHSEEYELLMAEFQAWEPEGPVIEQINEVLDRFTYWTDDSNNANLLGDIVQILGRTDIPG